jgi:hypothetical protein
MPFLLQPGSRPVRRLLVAALPLLIVTGLLVQASPARAQSDGSDAATGPRAAPAGSSSAPTPSDPRAAARRALQRVIALSSTPGGTPAGPSAGAVTRASTGPARHVDATLLLVALRRSLPYLDRADRARARSFLSRPTDPKGQLGGWTSSESAHGTQVCGDQVCVHWTTVGNDAPSLVDAFDDTGAPGPNAIPDQVDTTLREMTSVWDEEVGTLGYRAPKTDALPKDLTLPDRAKFDVYLSDVGRKGLYGFCAPEQNQRQSTAYCVLDDDFSPSQFGRVHTPLQDLQVTAAHEFFHAVQFNYDAGEDAWFMEASAAWIEDVVYPSVNDNLQYLANSPVSRPWQPADIGGNTLAIYGSWVWLRYLTDRFDVALVHRAWALAVGNRYSLQALALALPQGSASFARLFGDFVAANVAPPAFYREGGRYLRYAAAAGLVRRLGSSRTSTGWLAPSRLRHLSGANVKFVPARGARRLAVQVRTPVSATSPQVRLVVDHRSGPTTMTTVRVHRRLARTVIRFAPRTVTSVRVVVVNASRRTSCWWGTSWSCGGRPVDDAVAFAVRAALVR